MNRTALKTFSLILLAILAVTGVISGANIALAAGGGGSGGGAGGGGGGAGGGGGGTGGGGLPPGQYLSNLYIWFLGFVGIAALFAVVFGGVLYMFSGANLTQAGEGRKWITNAIWGIVLAAAAYLLLFTINPDLVTHGFDLNIVIEGALK